MKISVIGTFVRDLIYPWKGEPVNSIGGLFYTTAYLANLARQNDEIWPVCYVGEDFYDQVLEQLQRFKNVRTDCVNKIARENTTVRLKYTSPKEREETTTEPMPALCFSDLEPVLDSETTIINLITGVDMELDALINFNRKSESLIYLDFHSRTLGIDENGKRFLRKPDDWMEWFSLVDIVQMNEDEAFLLSERPRRHQELLNFGREVLDINPFICHVTLGERGSYLFYRNDDRCECKEIDAWQVEDVVDVVGCGDAFEAAFCLHYSQKRNIIAATEFANKIAGENTRFYGSSGIERIRKYMVN